MLSKEDQIEARILSIQSLLKRNPKFFAENVWIKQRYSIKPIGVLLMAFMKRSDQINTASIIQVVVLHCRKGAVHMVFRTGVAYLYWEAFSNKIYQDYKIMIYLFEDFHNFRWTELNLCFSCRADSEMTFWRMSAILLGHEGRLVFLAFF